MKSIRSWLCSPFPPFPSPARRLSPRPPRPGVRARRTRLRGARGPPPHRRRRSAPAGGARAVRRARRRARAGADRSLPDGEQRPGRGHRARRTISERWARTAERIVLDHAAADTAEAAARLDGVTGVWFGGGDQVLLTKALGGNEDRGRDPRALSRGSRGRRHVRRRRRHVDADADRRREASGREPASRQGQQRRLHDDRARQRRHASRVRAASRARSSISTSSAAAATTGSLSLVLEHPGPRRRRASTNRPPSRSSRTGRGGSWARASPSCTTPARPAITPAAARAPSERADVRDRVLPAGSRYDPRTGKATLPER